MKKTIISVMVVLVLLCPIIVFGLTNKLDISNTASSKEDLGDNKMKQYNDVYFYTTDVQEGEDTSVTSLQFTIVSTGPAVEAVECVSGDGFTANTQKNDDNTVTCVYTATASEGVKGEKIAVGKVAITADKNSPDKDCTVEYKLDSVDGKKVPPETGASLPYVIVGAGIVIAAGAYVVTRRKSKLFNV